MGKELKYETDGEVVIKHPENVRIGEGVFIGGGTFIDGYHTGPGLVVRGDSWIGQRCYIHAAGGVVVDYDVGVAPCVKIFTSYHSLEGISDIIYNPVIHSCVEFHHGCDVGVGAIILPGVTVGRFAQVGAGSVVTRDVPEYSVVAGNPARVISRREI